MNMTHTVLMLRLMLIITLTTICTRAQLVKLLFPGSSVSEAVLGKPCHTETHRGVCVKREQCGSAISSVGFNESNPCGPTAGFDVICCGNTSRTADVLDVSLPDVINSEGEVPADNKLVDTTTDNSKPEGNTSRTADVLDVSLPDVINPEGNTSRTADILDVSLPDVINLKVYEEIRWCSRCGKRGFTRNVESNLATTERTPEIMTEEERKVRMEEISRHSARSSGILSRTARWSRTRTGGITGGFEPSPNSWPWMALLGKLRPGGSPDWQCTGTVIRYGHDHKWIITAAHCFNKGVLDIVRLGEHNHTDDSETITSDHWIEKSVVHPEYSVRTGYHDMALLKLSRYPMDINKTNLNQFVAPICLPWGEKISEKVVGNGGYVAGWGATEFDGSKSPILQEGHVTIFNSSFCDENYKKGDLTEALYEKHYPDGIQAKYLLCAGHSDGGVDACKGDSGGPLMIKSLVKFSFDFFLTGVIAHGAGCGLKDYPGLYTPLHNPAYLTWIKKVAFNPGEPDHC